MSLVTLLSIARSALVTHQRAMDVTAHNVANAQTPGYSRQRLDIAAADPLRLPEGTLGRGITTAGISRARDLFHDASFREESGLLGRASVAADTLGQVEASMDEPSDTGLAATLDGFFSAFADLAANPTSSTNRSQARAAAVRVVERFRMLDGAIARAQTSANEQIRAQVTEVNTLAAQLAELNARILSDGGPDRSAADLQDQRDNLIDQLSSRIGVTTSVKDDGTVTVTAGDLVLVDHGSARTLEARDIGGGVSGLFVSGTTTRVDPVSGSLDGLFDMVNTRLPQVRSQLDALVNAFVTEVNALHRTGTTPGGATNTDLFDPAGVTAARIALTPAVQASADAIAASASGAAGDGTVAQRIAALASKAIGSLGNRTMRDHYVSVATGVGSDVKAAQQDIATYQALVDRSDSMRQSVSGVNVDEEMVALIGQQQAYSAAARLIKIADDMMTDLLNMI